MATASPSTPAPAQPDPHSAPALAPASEPSQPADWVALVGFLLAFGSIWIVCIFNLLTRFWGQ